MMVQLAAELRITAAWLELDDVVVADRGDLAADLARELSRAPNSATSPSSAVHPADAGIAGQVRQSKQNTD